MNKILIVSLGTSKQLLSCGYITPQLRDNNPHSEIHLLTLQENYKKARSLKHITHIHTIDREKIEKLTDGQLFSNGYALDTFYTNLSDVLETEWTMVVNQSHNTLSTIIVSCLNSENISGTSLTSTGTTLHSSEWTIALDSVNSFATRKPIGSHLITTHILGHPWSKSDDALKVSSEYTLLANQNFSRIRALKPGDSKIVGISLSQGYDGTYLDTKSLMELVGTLKESSNIVPVLLVDPQTANHRTIVNELNLAMGNDLISINVDFTAFSAIATHLDLMVTPATDYAVAADLQGIETLELRNSAVFKQEPVITTEGSRVLFYEGQADIASDIIYAINEIFDTELPLNTTDGGSSVFACVKDEYGYFFSQIKGEINLGQELNYHLSRSFFFNLLGYPENSALMENIRENCVKEDIVEFVNETRSELTGAVKILLATLRSLKSIRNSSDGVNSFLSYYDQLLAYGKQQNIVGHMIRFTEGKIENISSQNSQENLAQIEQLLFELKGHIQKITEACGVLIGDLPLERESEARK